MKIPIIKDVVITLEEEEAVQENYRITGQDISAAGFDDLIIDEVQSDRNFVSTGHLIKAMNSLPKDRRNAILSAVLIVGTSELVSQVNKVAEALSTLNQARSLGELPISDEKFNEFIERVQNLPFQRAARALVESNMYLGDHDGT